MSPSQQSGGVMGQIAAVTRWPWGRKLTFPDTGYDVVTVYREIFAELRPQVVLPESATAIPDCEQWGQGFVTPEGEGLVEERNWVWMVGADQEMIYHLLTAEDGYIRTRSMSYDHHVPDPAEPYIFELRAPKTDTLERLASTLVTSLAQRGASPI